MKLTIKENSKNYPCSVVKIGQIYPIEGADRIKRTVIYNNDIIIDSSIKEGDVMLYFVSGTKLNEDFCKWNNLLTDATLNKDGRSGYISAKKLLLKAVKLRGIVSDGLLLPISCLSNFVGDISSLKVGDEFTDIDDFSLCEKYFVPENIHSKNTTNISNNRKEKLTDLIVEKQFRFHSETSHFAKHLHKFEVGDRMIVTRKLHGCLPSKHDITMSDGSIKKIKDIKIGDFVLGYDHKLNTPVPTKVLNTFINGKTDMWYKFTKNQFVNGVGKKKKQLIVTGNHQIFVDGEYKSAENCRVGDKILANYQEYELSGFKENLLIGKMIGDGSLDIHNANKYAVTYGHKVDHEEYIDYINKCLGNFCTQVKDYRTSGYGTKMVRSRTIHNYNLNKLFSKWIINGKKQIPPLELNPIILAFWYMDDGSLSHRDSQKDRACFAICAYDEQSCENIRTSLYNYGFKNFIIYNDTSGYNRLRLNYEDAEILFNDIRHLIPECMQYKLPIYHRGYFNPPVVEDSKMTQYIQDSEIVNIEKLYNYSYSTKYDIETETHNFFAGDVLVHNSSGIISNVLTFKKLNFFEKVLSKIGVNIPKTEYGYIWSSGKPKSNIPKGLENSTHEWKTSNQSFYKEDIWKRAYNTLKSKCEKGITLYFEITGEGIQGSDYTYGKEYAIHVYRITSTNVDGCVYEFGWNEVKNYCNKYEINYCEEYEEIQHPTNGDDLLKYLSTTYLNKSYSDCKVDEGICIRHVKTNEIFKLKSPNFLLKEQKSLEEDVQTMEQ